eukprot:TRINITY_DN22117_c0_g1_i1.p2 TRINITY_DN22117_c0_g1~~TRINITY_DN22117_c0_g1_i1.p2  ORF type:complete len:238 (+),score=61.99 TRINITY_DN22117_c0_g1_i1:769-1482(+)
MDLSSEMLRAAAAQGCDAARCDMRRGLPLRRGTLDVVFSVGALHFLVSTGPPESAECFFASCRAALRPGGLLAAQFFPPDAAAAEALRAAAAAGLGNGATLVLDQPHRTQGRRWFLVARSRGGDRFDAPPCLMYGCGAACALAVRGPTLPPEGSHDMWLCQEHCRYAHRLLRRSRRQQQQEAGGSSAAPAAESEPEAASEAAASSRLQAAGVGLPSGGPSALLQQWAAVYEALHPPP